MQRHFFYVGANKHNNLMHIRSSEDHIDLPNIALSPTYPVGKEVLSTYTLNLDSLYSNIVNIVTVHLIVSPLSCLYSRRFTNDRLLWCMFQAFCTYVQITVFSNLVTVSLPDKSWCNFYQVLLYLLSTLLFSLDNLSP